MQQEAQSQTIRFTVSLIRCVGLTVLALIVWHVTLYDLAIYQEESNSLLVSLINKKKTEIAVFEQRQQNLNQFESRLKFIASLSQQNNHVGQLLDELQKVTPLAVTLTQLIRQGNALILDGNVRSDLDLIQLMENINKSSLFLDPAVLAMTKRDEIRYFQLKMWIKT